MRRNPVKTVWLPIWKIRENHFRELLDSEAGKRAFDQSFAERIRSRKDELEKTLWKLFFANFAIILALFLNSIVLPAEFSIGGLKATEIGKIKEILLFISGTLSMVAAVIGAETQALKSILYSWTKKNHSAELFRYLKMQYGQRIGELPDLALPAGRHRSPTIILTIVNRVVALAFVFFLVALMAINVAVFLAILKDVIEKPSLPAFWSWGILIYSGICYITNFVLSLMIWIPFPYRDYSVVMEIAALEKTNPEEYRRRIEEEYGAK